MTRRSWRIGVVAALTTGSMLAGRALSAEGAANVDEANAGLRAAMTPGEPQAFLGRLAGEWEVTIRAWLAGPAEPPTESPGRATCAVLLGGRFVQETLHGEMAGQPVEQMNWFGHDNVKRKFVASHIDSWSTGMIHSEGWRAEGSDAIVFWGRMESPQTGQRDKPVKYVARLLSADRWVAEIHDPTLPDGQTKLCEFDYRRRR